MKGIVFTEFLEMVEDNFGYEVVDKIIQDSQLASDGIYTAVGTYSHHEIVSLVTNLSQLSQTSISDLLFAFGKYLFNTFLAQYPAFFDRSPTAFDFLESIENHIHVEVKKLYPESELPKFDSVSKTDDRMEMIYTSERKMSDLALGLMERTLEHYGEKAEIIKENIEEDGSVVRFRLIKK